MRARTWFIVVVVALVASASAAQVTKSDVAGIRNYSRVDATVGCGGAVDPAAMATLRQEGYVSVVNLRLASEPGADVDAGRAAAEAAGLKYFHMPFDSQAPDPQLVERFLSTVDDESNQPVFIHCGSANRVGAVWMIKRVLQDGWDIERARTEAEAIGLRSEALTAFATEYINQHRN